jgi:hypothetical protein
MPPALLYPFLSFVPMGVVALILKSWHWWNEATQLRKTSRQKLLNPPGESTRQRKHELDDRITDMLVWILGFPPVLAVCYVTFTRTVSSAPSMVWAFVLVLGAAVYLRFLVQFVGLVEQRAGARLNLKAEQAVGEELNRLMAEGCQVFHDFPLEPKGCINHVIVAPSGVYAVETKARAKAEPDGRQKPHEVIYDGKGLQFPGCYDKEPVIHARNVARTLSDFLGRGVGNSVAVKPVVTFPGWDVTCKSPGDVLVLNPGLIRSAVAEVAPAALTAEAMKRISLRLEEKCRGAEF